MVKRSLDFRKSANGSYEAFYNNSSIGVSFFIPDQYTIDDYKDKIAYLDSGVFNPYDNLLFNITSSPKVFESAEIDSCGGVSFKDGLIISVDKAIEIKENKESTLILDSDSPNLFFDSFYCCGNENSTIAFEEDVRRDQEKLHRVKDKEPNLFYFIRNRDVTLSFRNDINRLFFVGGIRAFLAGDSSTLGGDHKIALYADTVEAREVTFLFGNSEAKLSVSSDYIDLNQSKLEIQDHCFITLKNKNRTSFGISGANFTIGILRGYPKSNELKKMATKGYDFPIHELSANVESFSVVTNGTPFSIYGNNYIEAKGVYVCGKHSTQLGYVDINISKNKLSLEEASLVWSDISLKNSKGDELLIKRSSLVKSRLTNFNSLKIENWEIKGFEADNLYTSPNSKIKSKQIDVKSENLTLDKKATLDIIGASNIESVKKSKKSKGVILSNVIVKGKTALDFRGDIECHNTIFDNLDFKNINSKEVSTKVFNSLLGGKIEGEDIQSIRESDIKDSIIYSRREEPISIEGKYLNGINDFDGELTEAKKEIVIPCSINKLEIL